MQEEVTSMPTGQPLVRTRNIRVCALERKIETGSNRESEKERKTESVCVCTSTDGTLRQRKSAGFPSARPDFLI